MQKRRDHIQRYGSLKVFFFIFMLLMFGVYSSLFAGQKWYSDLESALADAKQEKKPLMIDFYADWCHFCHELENKVYPSSRVSPVLLRYITVRVNGERRSDLTDRYRVRGFPTMVFLDPNGVEIARISGYRKPDELAFELERIEKRKDLEERILSEVKKSPLSIQANLEAGIYYSKAKLYERAKTFYLKSYRGKEGSGSPSQRSDAVYNAAVTSMQMNDYSSAVREWGDYIDLHPDSKTHQAYGKYWRGISYKRAGKLSQAKSDLEWASLHLPTEQEKKQAKEALTFD